MIIILNNFTKFFFRSSERGKNDEIILLSENSISGMYKEMPKNFTRNQGSMSYKL